MAREKRGPYADSDRHLNSRDEHQFFDDRAPHYPVGESGRDFLPGDEGPGARTRPRYPIGNYGRDYEQRDLRGPRGARDLEVFGGRRSYEVGAPIERTERTVSYRGRGPRGYKRSDEQINHEVCERLTDDHFVDASEITVAVAHGEVTLSGSVVSREQKRRAEAVIESISGVQDVHNRLRVQAAESRAEVPSGHDARPEQSAPSRSPTAASVPRGSPTHH